MPNNGSPVCCIGKPCGNTCIDASEECHEGPGGATCDSSKNCDCGCSTHCDCGNLAAQDCSSDSCGVCCDDDDCPRHS